MGSLDDDYGRAIAVDGSGDAHVTGYAEASWGSPATGHAVLDGWMPLQLSCCR